MQLRVEGGPILSKNLSTLDDYEVKDGAVVIVE
jgi:hypothetical protein